MAFRFNWPEFDTEFYDEAKSQLEAALNKGNKPKNIVDYITVKELNMGTKAPDLEILEIGELTTNKFRGIFKLTYAGDAFIVLQTKVQANPMHAKQSTLPRHTRPNILAADQPLVVPMLLRISDLRLRGIVVLVVSKTKGITLVFKNDPLENILISSTFDSVASVRNFLQREIEKQLRNLFQEDLPVMIHNLSLRHIQNEQEKAKKQQQEERLKAQQLRKLERQRRKKKRATSPPMSVFSDPGHQPSTIHPPMSLIFPSVPASQYDCSSLPDMSMSQPGFPLTPSSIVGGDHLSTTSFPFIEDAGAFFDSVRFNQLYRPTSALLQGAASPPFGSFSDLYYHHQQQQGTPLHSHLGSASAKSPPSSVLSSSLPPSSLYNQTPVTAANLSTLDMLYQHRLATAASASSYRPSQHPQDFVDDDDDDDDDDEGYFGTEQDDDVDMPKDPLASSPSASSAMASAYDIYSDDVDAPWYVTEGLGLPLTREDTTAQPFTLPTDQAIVLDPFENAAAAKLAQLAKSNHTISPFTHTIDHVTYKSLPYTVKPTTRPKLNKVPRRRIIRLNLSNSSSSNSSS
ncbi:hypothetical protein DM01DRAFT_1331424 [Hesseltinella vesiculosa]|uniref:Mitochondrial distribution and morphology protein 34 n=1 Tax=Hesseltinella vesiculosa TaxID=101127 RepID=A0A1X2GVA0_9FUNG|nr:hypothetical protein DM01DRAFT_1331424 [Hesseltinella vesiculosa]